MGGENEEKMTFPFSGSSNVLYSNVISKFRTHV